MAALAPLFPRGSPCSSMADGGIFSFWSPTQGWDSGRPCTYHLGIGSSLSLVPRPLACPTPRTQMLLQPWEKTLDLIQGSL